LYSTGAHAPLGGIEHGGWKLEYDGEQSDFFADNNDGENLSFSLGLKVRDDGTIVDIVMAGPAGKAGISPATKIVAIDGRQFTTTILREAIGKAVTDKKPLELLIKNGEYYKTYSVDYHGGEKYPHLVRVESMPDLVTEIIAAKTKK
jgi:predicted metalloprotease with PDZ domain